jgi:hypothetical protein
MALPLPAPGPADSPLASAERIVAAARAAGDHRREAAALTDLGLLIGRANPAAAAAAFESATTAAGRARDPALSGELDGCYGLFLVETGRAAAGLPMLRRALETARAAGDRHAEKTALVRLATAAPVTGGLPHAPHLLGTAAAIARDVGDTRHEAELHWLTAISYADLGRPDLAAGAGETAVRLYRATNHPEAGRLAAALEQFRLGGAGLPGPATFMSGAGFATVSTEPPASSAAGPGLLRMGLTALRAAAKFLGSGLATVPAEVRRDRLDVCETCEHHTGTRCRVCGCYTALKSHLTHESCPLRKWPV